MSSTPEEEIWNTIEYKVPRLLKIPKSNIEFAPIDFPSILDGNKVWTENIGNTRYYNINGKKYPSITSLIKATDSEGAEKLAEWREKLGDEKANKYTNEAARAGEKWHKLAELFLLKQPISWTFFADPVNFFKATNIALALSEQVKSVFAIEAPIFSDYYQLAGRMDVGVELIDGRKAILDFKTGRYAKTKNRLNKAAIQCCFYGLALTEQVPSCKIDTVAVLQVLPDKILFQTSPLDFWTPRLNSAVVAYSKLVN